jgi:hypothetical protein
VRRRRGQGIRFNERLPLQVIPLMERNSKKSPLFGRAHAKSVLERREFLAMALAVSKYILEVLTLNTAAMSTEFVEHRNTRCDMMGCVIGPQLRFELARTDDVQELRPRIPPALYG